MSASRRVFIELGVNDRKLSRGLKGTESRFKKLGQSIKSSLSGITTLGGIGAGFGIAALGKEVLEFEEKLTRIGIGANASNGELDKLRSQIDAVSKESGLGREQLLGAVDALTELQGTAGFSGDKMRVLAKAVTATGAEAEDLAGVVYALESAFGLKNAAELEQALSAVVAAGKDGAVPLKQMSVVLQQLSQQFAKVSASGKDGAADLAAAIQVGRNAFGSEGEVATGIKAFLTATERNASKFREFGVEMFKTGKDGKKSLRPLRDIIDAISKSDIAKDPELLTKAFGSTEAKAFYEAISKNRLEFERLSKAARESNAVQEDSQRFLASNAGKMKKSINDIKLAFVGAFSPQRIELFTDAVQKGVDVLAFAVEHADKLAVAFAAIKTSSFAAGLSGTGGALGGFAGNLSKASLALGAFAVAAQTIADKVDAAQTEAIEKEVGGAVFADATRNFMLGQMGFHGGRRRARQMLGRDASDAELAAFEAAALKRTAEDQGYIKGGKVLSEDAIYSKLTAGRGGWYDPIHPNEEIALRNQARSIRGNLTAADGISDAARLANVIGKAVKEGAKLGTKEGQAVAAGSLVTWLKERIQ